MRTTNVQVLFLLSFFFTEHGFSCFLKSDLIPFVYDKLLECRIFQIQLFLPLHYMNKEQA